MNDDTTDYMIKQAQESGEYIGTLQVISEGIEKGYMDLVYIKKLVDERLEKWGRKLWYQKPLNQWLSGWLKTNLKNTFQK